VTREPANLNTHLDRLPKTIAICHLQNSLSTNWRVMKMSLPIHFARSIQRALLGLFFQSSLDEPVGDNEGSAPTPWFHSTSNPCCRTDIETTQPSQAEKSVARSRHTPRPLL
jgi:hypothetical protein